MSRKLLKINLTDKTSSAEEIADRVVGEYIGGRGLCAYYLNKYLDENPLIFFNGPLTGTGYPMTDRCSVAHVSPYTGGLFRSDFGGEFGASLKAAGYDGLMITGKAETPTCIIIDKDIKFSDKPADGFSCVMAGKAAAKGIRHTGILCDGKFRTHRGSTGFAMFEKKLTSVCIKRPGKEAEAPANKQHEDIERLINASPALTGRLSIKNFGTAAFYDLACARGMLPHNFCGKTPDTDTNAYAMLKNGRENVSCGHCPVACKKRANGRMLPDYDDFAMMLAAGADINRIPEIHAVCSEQCFDIITLCHQIFSYSTNKNFEELLQEYEDNTELNSIKPPLTVRGLEIPAFDPRGAMGIALGYATSANGADWRTAMAFTHEILRKPVATDRLAMDGKAALNIASENTQAAADSLNVCRYAMFSASLEEYAGALNETAGSDISPAELAEAGGRIIRLENEIARRLGFADDGWGLPEIFFTQNTEQLKAIDKKAFMAELEKYRIMRNRI